MADNASPAPVDDADLKIILLGDSAVGKSKLVERFLVDGFAPRQASTFALTVYRHLTADGTRVDLWDTAGQDRFASLHPSYFHRAHCAVLVFDLTRKVSYQHLDTWYAELQQHRPGIPVIVAANKLDVDPAMASKGFGFAKKHEYCIPSTYFVSAADGTNVVKLFKDATKFAARFKQHPNEEDFSEQVLEAIDYFDRKDNQ